MESPSWVEGEGVSNEPAINPMHWAHQAPRCAAHSKRTGQPCRAPAVKGSRVCRMHGARGGAPTGERNGRYRTGLFTAEMRELRRIIRDLTRAARDLEESL